MYPILWPPMLPVSGPVFKNYKQDYNFLFMSLKRKIAFLISCLTLCVWLGIVWVFGWPSEVFSDINLLMRRALFVFMPSLYCIFCMTTSICKVHYRSLKALGLFFHALLLLMMPALFISFFPAGFCFIACGVSWYLMFREHRHPTILKNGG